MSLVPPPDERLPPNHRPAYKLIFLRVTADRPQTLVEAVQASVRMGARAIVFVVDIAEDGAFLLEAARRYPAMLFFADVKHGAALDASGREPNNLFARNDRISDERWRLVERLLEHMAQHPRMDFSEYRKHVGPRYWSEQDRSPKHLESGNASPDVTYNSVPVIPGCPSLP